VRIVFLNPSGQLGGAERALLDVMASLREREPDWILNLIATADGPLIVAAERLGVRAEVLPLPRSVAELGDGGSRLGRIGALLGGSLRAAPSLPMYVARLRDRLREMKPDVIHSNGFKMHVLGVWARPAGTPVVWHVHDFVRTRPIMSVLLRLQASRCAAAIANSASVAADLEALCGGRLAVYPVSNAVDLDTFSPNGPTLDLDELSGLPPMDGAVVRVGLVATLGWWKGHRAFLSAVARLPRDLPVRAYVVGGALYETAGSQRSLAELRELAEDLGVADRVGFTGFVPDVAAAMRALDVVVHASTEPEPFGLVIAEAMACGRAVVVSDAGGAAELFSDGVDALGHRPGDVDQLARAIEMLVRDADLRARIAAAGRASAERRFDRSRLATELIPIYRSVQAAGGEMQERGFARSSRRGR
jgi:glycosyltransferase involved in cell wall biosynthesis